MKIVPYNYLSNIPEYPEASKGFRYERYMAKDGEFSKYTNRWKNKEEILLQISELIARGEYWEASLLTSPGFSSTQRPGRGGVIRDGIIQPYHRDLCGLHMTEHDFSVKDEVLHYSWMDYCLIERCKFSSKNDEIFSMPLFYHSSIQYTRFETCEFSNRSFSSGEYRYCVFSKCRFRNFVFNRLPSGVFEYIVFSECQFENVDFSRVNLERICFSGQCSFEKIRVNAASLAGRSFHIGREIVKQMKRWDLAAYRDRKFSVKIIHQNLKTKKYQSVLDAYQGLSVFYRAVSASEEQDGLYENHIECQYFQSWTIGEYKLLRRGLNGKFRELTSRYLIGYGAKPGRPIIAWGFLNFLFAFSYLFSGVAQNGGTTIHREFRFDFSQTADTLREFGICLYYSVITSVTVGYGDVTPMPGLSMFLCSLNALIGLLLTTMFTVIFSRRFFK